MGENAKKIGEKLEGYGEKLFEGFGWTEIARDREIKCKKSLHKKQTHGLDILLSLNHPYKSHKQGIVVECKNRQMVSITDKNISDWVKELINSIDCAQNTDELLDLPLDDVVINTGLLLVHANDKYDDVKFKKSINKLSAISRRDPITIYIASNNEINRWNSLRDKIITTFTKEFKFIYPSINNSNQKSGTYMTLEYLYSKYFLGLDTYYKTEIDSRTNISINIPKMQYIVFSFDENIVESFKYMWSIFKFYQMQAADEYVFVFYPRTANDVQFINENFIQALKGTENPPDDDMCNKIKIEFIDNRELSPVDTGR